MRDDLINVISLSIDGSVIDGSLIDWIELTIDLAIDPVFLIILVNEVDLFLLIWRSRIWNNSLKYGFPIELNRSIAISLSILGEASVTGSLNIK